MNQSLMELNWVLIRMLLVDGIYSKQRMTWNNIEIT
jgi:hypothetical protein